MQSLTTLHTLIFVVYVHVPVLLCTLSKCKELLSAYKLDLLSHELVESDRGCTSRVYFDNVPLTSQKPCQYNNKIDWSEKKTQAAVNKVYLFSINYNRYIDI